MESYVEASVERENFSSLKTVKSFRSFEPRSRLGSVNGSLKSFHGNHFTEIISADRARISFRCKFSLERRHCPAEQKEK